MKRHLPLLLAACLPTTGAFAQGDPPPDTATSPVFGFQEFDCPGGSDTVVAVPFERPVAFRGQASAIAAGTAATREMVVTLAGGDPGWADDVLAGSHFLRFTAGNAAGRRFPVAGNTGAEVRVWIPEGHPDLAAEAGDAIDIIPHWTPATLFPPATQTTLHASSGLLPGQRGSELFVYPLGPSPENTSPDRVFFVTDAGWFESAEGVPAADDVPLPPHAVLVIRHPDGANDTVFRPAALVNASPSAVVLESRRGIRLDHFVSLSLPLPSTVSQLDFQPREFAPSPGLNPPQRRDVLLVFDNAVTETNRQPSARYFFHRGDWYRFGDSEGTPAVANDDALPAGAALVIRKAATLSNQATVWTQDPNL